MRLFQGVIITGLLAVCHVTAWAEGIDQLPAVERGIALKIQQAAPNLPIVDVKPSQMAGLYEVRLANGGLIFSTADGGHFVAGDLFQVTAQGVVNLTEADRDRQRAERLAAVDDEQKIVYSPVIKKASITVFTDIDCGYCQKLHAEMSEYLAAGIEVKYMAYPRSGIGTASYDKIVSAWCADDKQLAMTRLKAGQRVDKKTCENPVAEQFRLALELGLRGTPAIILESGELLQGYRPAGQMAQLLGL